MTRITLEDMIADAQRRLDRLEPEAALAAQRSGALIVDTRSDDERRRVGVIPGSVHIPLSVLEWRLDPDGDPEFHSRHVTGLDQWIVLACRQGYSSLLAAVRLQELGFHRATDLAGGVEAWLAAGLPVHEIGGPTPDLGDPEPT